MQKERIHTMAENQNNRRAAYAKKKADAHKEARRAAREAVLALLFETEYHQGEDPETILNRAVEARDIDVTDKYIRAEYLGIMENLTAIDTLLGRHARGWRTDRLSRVSRAVLRLGAYEMVYADKIPAPIAINEAVELAKKFDDPKARAFVNGVLNAIKNELEERGGVLPAAEPAPLEESDAEPVVEIELTVDDSTVDESTAEDSTVEDPTVADSAADAE